MKITVNEARQLSFSPKTQPIMSEAEALRRARIRYARDLEYLKDK